MSRSLVEEDKYINDPWILKEVAFIDAFSHENFPHVGIQTKVK